MKELLGDDIALLQRLEEVHGHSGSNPQWAIPPNSARLREITSPLSWISCFLSFMAVRCGDPEMKALMIYARLVLDLARKHGGRGWLDYDRVFRQQIAANPSLFSWGDLNPSLMAYTPDGSQNRGTWCSLCQEADHGVGECALLVLEPTPNSTPKMVPTRFQRSRAPYRQEPSTEICRRYNRGLCNNPLCRYRHACKYCHKDHPGLSCPNRDADSPPSKRVPAP